MALIRGGCLSGIILPDTDATQEYIKKFWNYTT